MKAEELKYKLRHVSGLMDLAYFYDGQVDDPLYYDRWSGRLEKIADKLIESYTESIRSEEQAKTKKTVIGYAQWFKKLSGYSKGYYGTAIEEGVDTYFDKFTNKAQPEVKYCSECGKPMEQKEIIIKGDIDTCDDCLCPE